MTSDEIIVAVLEKLGRRQALTEQESKWLEASLRRVDRARGRIRPWGPGRPLWKPSDDVTLRRHLKRNRLVRDIARAMGKTEDAIWSRIRKLRREGRLPPAQRPMAAASAEA